MKETEEGIQYTGSKDSNLLPKFPVNANRFINRKVTYQQLVASSSAFQCKNAAPICFNLFSCLKAVFEAINGIIIKNIRSET